MDQVKHRRLLWIDDDGEERFFYEKYNLEDLGWRINWALTVEDGARLLAEQVFDAILLDQMLRLSPDTDIPDVWGGCAMLYWLRRRSLPKGAPAQDLEFLESWTPQQENQTVGVTIVSAFSDDEIRTALKDVPGTELIMKPIDFSRLLECLNPAEARG